MGGRPRGRRGWGEGGGLSFSQVGSRWAVLGGFLTEDPTIYAPNLRPEFTPVDESIKETWGAGVAALRASGRISKTAMPDLFLPLTHQVSLWCRGGGLQPWP